MATAESTKQATSTLPKNDFFENANKRFLFTMSNRTPYTFILDQSRKECGVLDAPFQELAGGTTEEPAELCIRGYKRGYAWYGVTYVLYFRILKPTGKDSDYRLHVFVGVGEKLTNNRFGWYIAKGETAILSPQEWLSNAVRDNKYNQEKKDCYDVVLNEGGMSYLRGSLQELELKIEMLTDNESHSNPRMIIRPLTER